MEKYYTEYSSVLDALGAAAQDGRRVYRIWDDGCSITITADETEIREACQEWCEGGTWPDGPVVIDVRYQSMYLDHDGEECEGDDAGSVDVEVGENDAPPETACGTEDDDHDWQSPGFLGGCSENPGVWSNGGTTMTFETVCAACGIYRTEIAYGSQRNPGQADTVTYEDADERSRRWAVTQDGGLVDAAIAAYESASGEWEGLNWTQWIGDPDAQISAESYADTDWTDTDAVADVRADVRRKLAAIATEDEDVNDDDLGDIVTAIREYVEQVAADAEEAEREAAEAYDHLRAGRYAKALECAERASSLEHEYGDDPTWGRFLAAVEAVVEFIAE